MKGESLKNNFARIKSTFGYRIGFPETDGLKASVAVENATFFEAVEAVRKAANLTYDSKELNQGWFKQDKNNPLAEADRNVLTLHESSNGEKVPAGAKGPLLVVVKSVSTNLGKGVHIGENEAQHRDPWRETIIETSLFVQPGFSFSWLLCDYSHGESNTAKIVREGSPTIRNRRGWGTSEGLQRYDLTIKFNDVEKGTKEISLDIPILVVGEIRATYLSSNSITWRQSRSASQRRCSERP